MNATRAIQKHKHAEAEGLPAIAIRGLSVRYGQHVALEDLTLEVPSGARVAVVGPNGAGKSTLFHVLAGVLTPDEGNVRVHEHRPTRYLCTAYVSQSRQLDWDFPVSVADVVMMGRTGLLGLLRRPGTADQEAVRDALNQMGIGELAERQVGALSGGQRQRMFVARALAQEAELLLLDEPLAGLDLSSQEQIFDILDVLRAQGVTVLVATHDLNLAVERFDHILLLKRHLLGFGDPEDVLTNENLHLAYGGHVEVIATSEGRKILGDMGGHHAHDEGGPHG
ncbi:MAG: metal ABC transporter ATP-binding protein [Chloroflexi bacterium]|nr:metal ABC transporter ATP-binding protein [Chloroflexota bacterium]